MKGEYATITDTTELARRIRVESLQMVARASASHVGAGFSIADILAVLYGCALRIDPKHPEDLNRDRFILSKGHAAAALYATLALRGFFPLENLLAYCKNGSAFSGHVSHEDVPGVEVSTGSLGHGLSIGCGMSLAARSDGSDCRAVVLLSDGELDEGSVWESAMFAAHHELANLLAIIDYNRIQSFGRVEDVLALEPLADKWRAWGWQVSDVDGHDHSALLEAIGDERIPLGQPRVIIANTTKGKGVSFMEDRLEWHYHSPNYKQLEQALTELGEM